MKKRIATAAVALLATVGLAAGCATPEAPKKGTAAAPKVTIGMTYIPDVQFSPFYVAEDSGSYKKLAPSGVELRHHGESEGLFDALRTGKEQFVVAGADEMLVARSQGMDLVAIRPYYAQYPVKVLVREETPIKKITDLKGKRVGLPGKFGSNWFGLLAALEAAGMTEKDITIVEIGYTQQAAVTTNQVDAVVGFINSDYVRLEQAGIKMRAIDLSPQALPLVGHALITTEKFAKDNPELVSAVVAATGEGIDQVVADPETAMKACGSRIPGFSDGKTSVLARAVLDATRKLLAPSKSEAAKQDPKTWEAMASFLKNQGIITGDPRVAGAMSNEYLDG